MDESEVELQNAPVLKEINSWDEVPAFASEDEEADFWGSHGLGPGLAAEAEAGALNFDDILPPPGTVFGLSLGFSAEVARRLRALAKKKHLDYVAMTRTFVMERLDEEEKREGIVGDSKAS